MIVTKITQDYSFLLNLMKQFLNLRNWFKIDYLIRLINLIDYFIIRHYPDRRFRDIYIVKQKIIKSIVKNKSKLKMYTIDLCALINLF